MATLSYEKIMYKGNEAELPAVDPPTSVSKLRFTVDTHRIFLDVNGERIEFSDFIKGNTDNQIKAILAPLPKLYLASDTRKLYINDNGEWVSIQADADQASKDGNGNIIVNTYAVKDSPVFSGTPTTPDVAAGDSTLKIANTKFVSTAIANAISGITSFDYEMVNSLPATGVKGTIYFVPITSPESSDNIYEEYLWITSTNRFEKIGTFSTEIDLSQYVNNYEVTGSGNAITGVTKSGNKLTFTKDSSFLTAHPTIPINSSTATSSPNFGDTVTVVTQATQDSNGHITNLVKTNVTLPSSTATTAVNGLLPKLAGGTDKYLRADGTWVTPTNTTYGIATTAANGLLPKLGGGTSNFLRADGTWATPSNTTYGIATTAANGLLPKLGGGTANFLRADGSWATPPNDNTTYAVATTAANGLLPKLGGGTTNFLRADGTWATPSNTTYGVATTAANGLLPKLTGATTTFMRADGSWAIPSNTTYAVATTAANGLLPKLGGGTSNFLRADGSWATPPNDNTTYAVATTAANGLLPKLGGGTANFLRADGSWATPPNTTYAVATTAANGLLPKLGGGTTNFLRADGSWATPPNDDTKVTAALNSGNAYRPLLLANATTATTGNVNNTVLRNNSLVANPYTGELKCTSINAIPAVGVDFDFGYLNSTTAGDETYGA